MLCILCFTIIVLMLTTTILAWLEAEREFEYRYSQRQCLRLRAMQPRHSTVISEAVIPLKVQAPTRSAGVMQQQDHGHWQALLLERLGALDIPNATHLIVPTPVAARVEQGNLTILEEENQNHAGNEATDMSTPRYTTPAAAA